jgi:hypothetical protein
VTTARWLRYHDELTFLALWTTGFARNAFAGEPDIADLVLVWDEKPLSDSSRDAMLAPHLTPLDWALVYSIQACRNGWGCPSIHIIDIAGRSNREDYAIIHRHQWLAEMPWVAIYSSISVEEQPSLRRDRLAYRPLTAGRTEARGLLARAMDNRLELNVDHGIARIAPNSRAPLAALERLLESWAATLPQIRDHHDLNNIIGPALLTGLPTNASPELRAIVQKVRALPRWSEAAGGKPLRMKGLWSQPPSKHLFGRKPSVVIVDDCVKEWLPLVRSIFFGSPPAGPDNTGNLANFYEVGNADKLVTYLQKATFHRRSYGGTVSSALGGSDEAPEIIFLDLRLTDDAKSLKSQSKTLLAIAERLNQEPATLAWPAVGVRHLAEVREWCADDAATAFSPQADRARLLLPMLLALALPLTPVVLFSSTGQPWIKELLRPYRNVLTRFEKPRVLAGPGSVVTSIVGLIDALALQAMPLLRLSTRLACVQSAIRVAERMRESLRQSEFGHFEIYADEKDDATGFGLSSIISGVVIAAFKSESQAETLQQSLEQEFHKPADRRVWATHFVDRRDPLFNELSTRGVRFDGVSSKGGWFTGLFKKGSHLTKNSAETQSERAAALRALLDEALPEGGWALIACATRVGLEFEVRNAPHPSLRGFPDGPLDSAIRFNTEFSLCALIPFLTTEYGTRTVRLDFPTRWRHVKDKRRREKYARAFQLSIEGEGLLTYSLNRANGGPVSSIFPLVRGWLAAWPRLFSDRANVDVVAVRATNLTIGTGHGVDAIQSTQRRLIHDLADWVCAASVADGEPLRRALLESKVFDRWILPESDADFRETAVSLMAALRIASGDRVGEYESRDALRYIVRAGRVSRCDLPAPAEDWSLSPHHIMLWGLRSVVETASGAALLSIAGLDDEHIEPV